MDDSGTCIGGTKYSISFEVNRQVSLINCQIPHNLFSYSIPGSNNVKYPVSLKPLYNLFGCFLFICFVALRPKSTAIVIAGRSVHLTTFFLGQA